MSSEESVVIKPEENPIIKRYPSAAEEDAELNVNVLRLLKNGRLTDDDKRALLRILYKALGPIPDLLEYWSLLDRDVQLDLLRHLSNTASGATKMLSALLYECLTKGTSGEQK